MHYTGLSADGLKTQRLRAGLARAEAWREIEAHELMVILATTIK